MNENFEINAKIMRAFSDPQRLQIIKLLNHQTYTAKELLYELNISQPTLSHHMKILVNSGVVSAAKSGKWYKYSLNKLMIIEVSNYLKNVVEDKNEDK